MKFLEIKNIENYKANKESDAVLGDDFRIIGSWFSTLKRTGEFKYTEEQIYNLAKDIIGELVKRGKTEFHPETWEQYSDELYSKIFAELQDEKINIPNNVANHLIVDIRVVPKKKIKESKHKRDKCMESDCELKPKYEFLWAEGMAHAWFCENHSNGWVRKIGKEDVCSVKEIKDGEASPKFSENTNPNIWKELEPKLKESDFSSWDPKILTVETPEELASRLDAIYELWIIRGFSEQDEDVLNAYLNLKSELEKREIEFEPIEEFEIMADRLKEGIRPAFGSSGEKKYLARTICSYIPDHKVYVEPFIGGGAVFFKKNPSEKEIINDLDKEISGAYKYIKEGKFEGLNKYRKDGNREYFKQMKASQPKTLEEQFYKFIYTLHFSFGNGRTAFAPSKILVSGRTSTLEPRFEHLTKVAERLQNTEVRNEDFRKLLKEFDSKETFFYLDPPYPEQQGKLITSLTNDDLWEAVKNLKGKWIMSLPDTPNARKIFNQCFIEGVEVRRTFNMATEHKDMELLISNFPLKQSTTWISESVVTASWLDDYTMEIKAQIDEVGNIILVPNYICLTGSMLYAKNRLPNDVDVVWRDQTINPDWLLKVNRLLHKITGNDTESHASASGPNWRYYPLWNLALVPVKGAQFAEVGAQEPGFASQLYERETRVEDYPQNYGIFVNHFRGRSVHVDFRRKQDGYLEGETIMNQPEGFVTEEVDTLEKGKKWNGRLLDKGKFRPDMDPNDKVVMVGKARHPLEWLNAREVIFPPESVGATKFEPGVFITMDEGMVYPGAQKPYFKEFFLDMKYFKGRMVERVIGTSPDWDEPSKGSTQWQAWTNMEDQIPYILSSRQRKDKRDYIPAAGEKAIPPEWENKVQPGFRWWLPNLTEKEKMNRLDLAYNDLIERGLLNGTPIEIKESLLKEKIKKGILRWHWWKGQKVVRDLPATDSRFELLIDTGKEYLDRWDFSNQHYGNPLKDNETTARRLQMNIGTPVGGSFRDWLKWSGAIPGKKAVVKKHGNKWIDQYDNILDGPKGGVPYGNPNEETPANIEIKDEFNVEIVTESDAFILFKFDGNILNGYWSMERESPDSDIWVFSKNLKYKENNLEEAATAKPEFHDLTMSQFPIEITFENSTYSLIKTKNGKLLLNK